MLLFNHKKEFLGIDSKYLELFGYASLSDLLMEVDQFADLFVKKPGFIHNFKHVDWIDFIQCADSQENAKVIINANARNFQCFMSVNIIYLTEEPALPAYQISLHNIKELTDNETKYISVDLLEQTMPSAPTPKIQLEPTIKPAIKVEVPKIETVEIESFNTDSYNADTPLDLDFGDSFENQFKEVNKESVEILEIDINPPSIVEEKFSTVNEIFDNGYIFDPLIASTELGLPVDLIEEFIEDFIAQAKEFKDELYQAQSNADDENIKVLSHKLKGVAANLRIEDALESLAAINTTTNNDDIKTELDTFYKIISKLSGETIEVIVPLQNNILHENIVSSPVIKEEPLSLDLDELDLDFKEEKVKVIKEENLSLDLDELDFDFKEEKIDIVNESSLSAPVLKEETLSLDLDELELDFKEDIDLFKQNSPSAPVVKEETLSLDLDELELDFKEDIDLFKQSIPSAPVIKEDTLSLDLDELELDFKEDIDLFKPSSSSTPVIKEDTLSLDLDELELDFKEEKNILTPLNTYLPTITYNKRVVASEIGLDQESFNELFEDYTLEAQDLSNSIDKAIQAHKITTWQHLSVRLKGMSDNMRVKDFIKELETLINTKTVDVAREANTHVSQCITQLLKIKE